MIEVLAFEGPDKVGKSTLIRALNRATDYRYLCIDRFLASAWVYDRLSGRRDREDEIQAAEHELAHAALVRVTNVLVRCDRTLLAGRIIHEDEEPEARLAKLDQMITLYDQYKATTRLPFIEVDTSYKSVGDTVQEIIGKLRNDNE